MENWVDGGSFDNKDDIDVYDYGLPRGEFELNWLSELIQWELFSEYKRGRQYTFGLGKRKYSDELDKRLPNR